MYSPEVEAKHQAFLNAALRAAAFLLITAIVVFLVSGCTPHRIVAIAPSVDHQTWGYREQAPDHYLVWVKEGPDSQAKEELCTKSYVCSIEPAGHVLIIERTRK